MTDFITKDSGERQEYESGMRRDTQDGKARFDLTHPLGVPYEEQMLTRFASLLARGAKKYGDRNWEKGEGEEELTRAYSSAFRHFMQWMAGETDEDHAAAVWFNILQVETLKYKMKLVEAAIEEKVAYFLENAPIKLDVSNFSGNTEKVHNNMRDLFDLPPILTNPNKCPACQERLAISVNYRTCTNGDGQFTVYDTGTNTWQWRAKPAVPAQRNDIQLPPLAPGVLEDLQSGKIKLEDAPRTSYPYRTKAENEGLAKRCPDCQEFMVRLPDTDMGTEHWSCQTIEGCGTEEFV